MIPDLEKDPAVKSRNWYRTNSDGSTAILYCESPMKPEGAGWKPMLPWYSKIYYAVRAALQLGDSHG